MSTIDNAKKVMGWKHPNNRAGCGNCAKSQFEPQTGFGSRWRCTLGGFFTHRYAICAKHEPVFPTGGAPK